MLHPLYTYSRRSPKEELSLKPSFHPCGFSCTPSSSCFPCGDSPTSGNLPDNYHARCTAPHPNTFISLLLSTQTYWNISLKGGGTIPTFFFSLTVSEVSPWSLGPVALGLSWQSLPWQELEVGRCSFPHNEKWGRAGSQHLCQGHTPGTQLPPTKPHSYRLHHLPVVSKVRDNVFWYMDF